MWRRGDGEAKPAFSSDRGGGFGDRDRRGPGGGDGGGWRGGGGGDRGGDDGPPRERPRLNLKPRTMGGDRKEEESRPARTTTDPFGGARPTAGPTAGGGEDEGGWRNRGADAGFVVGSAPAPKTGGGWRDREAAKKPTSGGPSQRGPAGERDFGSLRGGPRGDDGIKVGWFSERDRSVYGVF